MLTTTKENLKATDKLKIARMGTAYTPTGRCTSHLHYRRKPSQSTDVSQRWIQPLSATRK